MVSERDAPDEPVITHPRLLNVEVSRPKIVSSEDRFGRMNERLADARMGVRNDCILDPEKQIGFQCSGDQFQTWTQSQVLTVSGTKIEIAIDGLLADFD